MALEEPIDLIASIPGVLKQSCLVVIARDLSVETAQPPSRLNGTSLYT